MSKKIRLTDGTKLTLKELAAPDVSGNPRVMTLLREKKLNPEDVPEELLHLTDNSGMSVLGLCIERFQEPVKNTYKISMLRVLSLASSCLLPLHFRMMKRILTITDSDGNAVAHELAERDLLPEKMMIEKILKLKNKNGCSVAYILASRNTLPEWAKQNKDILMLGQGGFSVACALACNNQLPKEMMTEEILMLRDRDGWIVACYLTDRNLLPKWAKHSRRILALKETTGKYIAYELAQRGDLPLEMMTPEMLQNKRFGCTVLDRIVQYRYLTPEILALSWDKSTRVFEYVQKKEFRKKMNDEDLVYVDIELSKLQFKKRLVTQTDPDTLEMER